MKPLPTQLLLINISKPADSTAGTEMPGSLSSAGKT
jgi:hypothetical protein